MPLHAFQCDTAKLGLKIRELTLRGVQVPLRAPYNTSYFEQLATAMSLSAQNVPEVTGRVGPKARKALVRWEWHADSREPGSSRKRSESA